MVPDMLNMKKQYLLYLFMGIIFLEYKETMMMNKRIIFSTGVSCFCFAITLFMAYMNGTDLFERCPDVALVWIVAIMLSIVGFVVCNVSYPVEIEDCDG